MKPLKPVQVTCHLHPVPESKEPRGGCVSPWGWSWATAVLTCVHQALRYEQSFACVFLYKMCNRSDQNSAFPEASWIFLHIPSLAVRAPGRWQALYALWRAPEPSLGLVTQQVPLSRCQTPSADRRAPGLHPGPRLQVWWQLSEALIPPTGEEGDPSDFLFCFVLFSH